MSLISCRQNQFSFIVGGAAAGRSPVGNLGDFNVKSKWVGR